MLLNNGANVGAKDDKGETALTLADSTLEIIPDLIKNTRRLSYLAQLGENGDVLDLLAKGTPFEAKNDQGRNALHRAAQNGNIEVVKSLLAHGANVHITDKMGDTPLHLAAINSAMWRSRVVEILLKNGANVEAKNNKHETALKLYDHWNMGISTNSIQKAVNLLNASKEANIKAVKDLLKQDARFEAKDNEGKTALHWAAENGFLEIVEALLKKGAKIETKDNNGKTALDWAKSNRHADVIDSLLKKHIVVEKKQSIDLTDLHESTSYSHKKAVKSMPSFGATIEAEEDDISN